MSSPYLCNFADESFAAVITAVGLSLCPIFSLTRILWLCTTHKSPSVKIVETLGSLKLIREKFSAAGLWLVKLLILANHRSATENFSLITWSDPSVSTIFTLLATCALLKTFTAKFSWHLYTSSWALSGGVVSVPVVIQSPQHANCSRHSLSDRRQKFAQVWSLERSSGI